MDSLASDEGIIHGIGNLSDEYLIDDTFIYLNEEAEYYEHFKYETKGKLIEITYCLQAPTIDDPHNAAISTSKILETPFNWKGYDKPYWWDKSKDFGTEQIPNNYSTGNSTG